MRREERAPTIRIVIWAIVFVLAMVTSGCGLAADGVNHVRAIQFDPGDLYSPEFYRTATPDEVKKAIGGRSLAYAAFRKREFAANTEGHGFLAALDGALKSAQSVFIPMSSVDEGPAVYPLAIAMRHTPYPEVVALLLDAGADMSVASVPGYVASGGANPEIGRLLLSRASPELRCASLIALAGAGSRPMLEYCLGLEGVSANCRVNGDYPLKGALRNGKTAMAEYLLERGAVIPEDGNERFDLLAAILRTRNTAAFWAFHKRGLHSATATSPEKKSLLYVAQHWGVAGEDVLLHLAGTVPLAGEYGESALEGALRAKNAKVLGTVLKRLAKDGIEGQTGLKMLGIALRARNADLFWRLAAAGADCSLVDGFGNNDLLRQASWSLPDRDILAHLARRVPLDGRNERRALAGAMYAGYAEPVRILIERGVVPEIPLPPVSPDAVDGEAIRAMLAEKGFL